MKRMLLEQIITKEAFDEAGDYQAHCRVIRDLIEKGAIKPVKASGLNGKKPALYREYWIVEEKKDYSHLTEELKYEIIPAINTDYYLNHLEQYEKDRYWVLMTNEYLKTRSKLLDTEESLNERCFEIWGREKFIKEGNGGKILKRMGISLEYLNLYETTEPLAYYSHTKNTPQNLLILENKDTFYTMRRYLMNGNSRILGMETGTLIYGAGKGILRSFKDFALSVEPYISRPENRIWYFGDLDYEGIGIYEKLQKLLLPFHRISPMTEAYTAMVKKSPAMALLPDSRAGQVPTEGELFFDCFKPEAVKRMKSILENGKYIPQEIITIRDLKTWDNSESEQEAPWNTIF